MKKLLALCLALVIILSTMPIISVSAVEKATFSVGNVTGAPGDEVTVPVSIDTNPGLTFAQVKIGYITEAFEIVKVETLTLAGKSVSHGPITANPIAISWADCLADTTETGVIANIIFKIKDNAAVGDYTLEVSAEQENIFNINYDDVPFTTVNGTITVESNAVESPVVNGLTFIVGNVTGAPGEEVSVPVEIAGNPGITFAQVIIGYDANALEIVNVEKLTLAGKPASSGPITANPIAITWADCLADTTENGVIANIIFKIKDDAAVGDYTLEVSAEQENIFNINYDDVAFTTINGTVTVGASSCAHNWVEVVDDKYLVFEATCESKAIYYKSCSLCGIASDEAFQAGDYADHIYGEWVVTKESTETETGLKEKECSVCGDKVIAEIPKLPLFDKVIFSVGDVTGVPGEEVTVPVSIDANPGITFAQVKIGYDAEAFEIVKVEKLTLAGKPASSGPITANPIAITWADGLADTTENGVIANIIFRIKDGASGTYELTAEGIQDNIFNLNYENVPFVTINGAIIVHEHNWVEVVDGKYLASEATCVDKATYYMSCSICGYKHNETFEFGELNHNNHIGAIGRYPAVEPRCEEDGCTYSEKCNACGEWIIEPIVLPAMGHDYTELVHDSYLATEATCSSMASYYLSCSRCFKVSDSTFEAGEFDSNNHVGTTTTHSAVESTCTIQGNEEYVTCDDCGVVIVGSDAKLPLLPHTYDTEYDYTCNVCQYSRAPHAPTLAKKYSGTIILNLVDGLEYSYDGISWQTSPIFENLAENTEYTFVQRVKATDKSKQSEASEGVVVYLKLSQATPDAPIILSFTDTVIELLPIENGEYSLDGINWQSSTVFEGLQPATQYKLYQRCIETETHEMSGISAYESITTDKAKQVAIPNAPVVEGYTDHSITLVAVDGCEYSIDGKNWQSSTIFEGLLCGTKYTFYQRYKETDIYYAGQNSDMLTAKTDKGTQAAPSAPTLLKVTSKTVTLVAIEGYEYSRDGVNWQISNVFDNLDPSTSYLFYQRKAETDTHYASVKSSRLIAKTSEITIGDANNDGVVTGKDYTLILQSINGWQTTLDTEAADVNGDGTVNGRDYTILLQYINGWDVKLH